MYSFGLVLRMFSGPMVMVLGALMVFVGAIVYLVKSRGLLGWVLLVGALGPVASAFSALVVRFVNIYVPTGGLSLWVLSTSLQLNTAAAVLELIFGIAFVVAMVKMPKRERRAPSRGTA
jgi:hypothetical protein